MGRLKTMATTCKSIESFLLCVTPATEYSISLGISRTDGSLHLIFDQHDNDLRYRSSTLGVATNPTETIWAADVVFTSSILVRSPVMY